MLSPASYKSVFDFSEIVEIVQISLPWIVAFGLLFSTESEATGCHTQFFTASLAIAFLSSRFAHATVSIAILLTRAIYHFHLHGQSQSFLPMKNDQ
jgi:hypothetical protein